MLDLAPEEVVILLEGELDSDLLTVGDDSLLALGPLHLSAVSGAAHSAHGAPDSRAGVLNVGGLLLLLQDGQVGLNSIVYTSVSRHLLLNNLVNQIALLPGLVSAVLLAGEDLLTLGIDLPFGVTDLLGDIPALRHLLDLPQGLKSVRNAFLGCKGVPLSLVTPDRLVPLLNVAGVASLHGALGAGQGDTDPLGLGEALPLHLVAADVLDGCVVLQMPVFRNIHTLILGMAMVIMMVIMVLIMVLIMVHIMGVIVVVVVVVSWLKSHTLGDKSKEDDLSQHVGGCEDS